MSETAIFLTIGGRYVEFTEKVQIPPYGSWKCEGCGDSNRHALRSSANEHAAACRAI
ncbi:hypothetical protein AB0M95_27650 [Sphaerisporangium sp. NPDC051017]|uniref:hypothetical protein n=1 Tax=Sphaerisporangium sp. NPDC051017 TaxID=3154636 RepID=UPI003425FF77